MEKIPGEFLSADLYFFENGRCILNSQSESWVVTIKIFKIVALSLKNAPKRELSGSGLRTTLS